MTTALQQPEFRLIEQGQQYCMEGVSKKAGHWSEPEGSYFTPDLESLHIVRDILACMIQAQAADKPVILNRTGQIIEEAVPEHFCIGLQTSGTTGAPKLIFHELSDLLPANHKRQPSPTRWLLCYHPMSFAGLQVILQALVSGDILISSPSASVTEKASVAVDFQVNAISATPSYLKALSLCWQEQKPDLKLMTCGGEISNQSTLDYLKALFPTAHLRHIYATTETGVVFTIKDGLEGFPADWLNREHQGWIASNDNGYLLLSKANSSLRYNTGDLIAVEGGRVLFKGRADHIVNVGGAKVNLESVEQTLARLPAVEDIRVYARTSPITGYIVCAEVATQQELQARQQINLKLPELRHDQG